MLALLVALSVPGVVAGELVHAVWGDARAFHAVLADGSRWLTLLTNTLIAAGVAVGVVVTVATVLGALLGRTLLPGRGVWTALLGLGACVPLYVIAVLALALLPGYRVAGSAWTCGVLYGLVYTPLGTLVMRAAWRGADRNVEEQALLHASPVAVLWRVTLPLLRGTQVALGIIVFLLVATDFTITDLYIVRTFAEEVYTQYQVAHRRVGPLLTGVPLLVVHGLGLAVLLRLGGRWVGDVVATPNRSPLMFSLGRWRHVAVGGMMVVGVSLVGVPLGSVVSRVESWEGFVASARALRELQHSTVLATVGATLLVLPSVGLAWTLVRRGWLRWVIVAAVVALLSLPAPVVGIALIGLLNHPGWLGSIYDSPVVIIIGYYVRFLPIAILLMTAAVTQVRDELVAAARVDGCAWWGVQRHVVWPTVRRGALVTWLIMMILCFGEVGTTVLVVPPGWETASVRAFTLMHFGVYRDLAVLALLSIACILVPWGVLVVLFSRRSARSADGRARF